MPPKVTLTKTNLDYPNFNSEPRIYKKQQVYLQQPNVPISGAYISDIFPKKFGEWLRYDKSIPSKDGWHTYKEKAQPQGKKFHTMKQVLNITSLVEPRL